MSEFQNFLNGSLESEEGYIFERNIRKVLKCKSKLSLNTELENYLNKVEPNMIYSTITIQSFSLPLSNIFNFIS